MDAEKDGGMPLDGIRVLDLGRYIAAPFCAALFADMGADVIRIDPPGGASDREVTPIGGGADGALYQQVNRNKRSLTLDLETERGHEIFHALARCSDDVVINVPPKVLERMGLDYPTLSAVNPRLVLTTISAYGFKGDQRDAIGFDGTRQALSGAMHLTGTGERPMRAAVSYVDYATGLAAAHATLGALLHRQRTGRGQHVEASLLATAVTMTNPMLIEEACRARSRKPTGNRSPIAGPSDIFATADGWIMVQVIGDAMFSRWAKLVGRRELLDDARFSSDIRRGENGEFRSAVMAEWCRPRNTDQCLVALSAARAPGCRVLSPAEALKEPSSAEGGFFAWQRDETINSAIPSAAPIIRLPSLNALPVRNAPALGRHTDAILASLGLSPADRSGLKAGRVI